MKLNSQEIIKKWTSDIRQDKSRLYLYEQRQEHLELLMAYFKANDVEMEEASLFKRAAVNILVHEEGMKGKGRYKNWKETAEQDFDDWIQRTYIPSIDIPKASAPPTYNQKLEIVSWAKKKYGEDVSSQFLKECHQIGHILNVLYFDELQKES